MCSRGVPVPTAKGCSVNAEKRLGLGLMCLAWLVGGGRADEPAPPAVKSVRVQLAPQASPVAARLATVFARQVNDRCDARAVTEGETPLVVEFATDAIGPEHFRIEDRPGGGVRIVGLWRARGNSCGRPLRSRRF